MYYLIRVKDITSNGITSKLTMLPESGEFDEWVNVTLTKKQTNEVKQIPKNTELLIRKRLLIILICILIIFTK